MGDSVVRRATEGMPVNSATLCKFARPVGEDYGQVKIRDVSIDGVSLLMGRRVEVNALLVIGLENAARGFARTMFVRVEQVASIPGGFLVRGAFEEPLTYQEFTSLVM